MNNLYISKKNLLNNLKVVKSKTKAKICAVVKGNAYGHGIKNICTILKSKVDFFAVASLEEALEIRDFDSTTNILILGYCDDFIKASEENISVTIFSLNQLEKLKKQAKNIKKIKIHLKVDTGMNRIGFSTISNFKKALNLLKKMEQKFFLEGVFTHFATLKNDIAYFNIQQEKFNEFLKLLNGYENIIIHGGGSLTLLHSTSYNMLRFGIYLYGYGLKELKPVLSISSKIIQTKAVRKNENVGYSKNFITKKDCNLAVLPIGYYDGIPKSFINQYLYYKKQPLKILSVCMDMTIIELPQNVKPNVEITIFNDADSWAKILKTNYHDVLVGFNSFRGKVKVKK